MFDIYKITNIENVPSFVEKINPVFGGGLTAIQYYHWVVGLYKASGKLLTPSELGCTLSHLNVYKKIVEKNTAALILESDIEINSEDVEKVKSIISNKKIDFIHLGWHPSVEEGVFFRGDFIKALRVYRVNPNCDFHGAYSYYITPKCAKMLIDFHKKNIRKADEWSVFFNKYDIEPYFYPVFTHPVERHDMQEERLMLPDNVYAFSLSNFIFYFSKKFRRITSRFFTRRKITKEKFNFDSRH